MSDDVLNATAQGQLKSIIERLERLEVEKGEIAEQIKEVKAEARGNGFDVKILGKVVRIRKQDRAKRQEEEAILDLYLSAVGEAPAFERDDGGIRSITITAGGRSVTTTPEVMAKALNELKDQHELYDQAVALVRESGKASTSYIQRRLQVGYNRAAELMERMERAGVVGAADHAGKREILAEAAHG